MSEINSNDTELLEGWYRHVAEQPGFVGSFLRLLCEKQKTTLKQQQKELGISDNDFTRLQGMPLPRPGNFTSDARRIAGICNILNVTAFVNALLLARSIERSSSQVNNGQTSSSGVLLSYYQAAYDADDDLDKLPKEE